MSVITVIERRVVMPRTIIMVRERRVGQRVGVNNRIVAIEVCVWRRQQPGQRHRQCGGEGEAAGRSH